jgi:hypothetical protein
MAIEDLKQNEMMAHLANSLDSGQDIGHYGRLVFAMVGGHFLTEEELTQWLTKDPSCNAEQAEALVKQVNDRGYNPPKPDRILDWMNRQEFPICPHADHAAQACNVYRDLQFPEEVYRKIESFHRDTNVG